MLIQFSQQENQTGVVTLAVKGDIDMSSAPDVREKLTALFKQNKKAVIVDLSGVPYMDSSGIATMVEGLQWSHSSKNRFRLAGLTPAVKDVFEISRLLPVFETFDSCEQALQGV